tara:strand:- start:465 stop:731 length:267 start_codon:yes stop_codon:yes gene_type:complete
MKNLFEIFQNLSWGWPREWEELTIIIILGFLLTVVYRTSKIFMKFTIGLTVVGLIALLAYSLMEGKGIKKITEIANGDSVQKTIEASE